MYPGNTGVLEAEAARRAQVERIFRSKAFRSSDVLRHLLSYLVDASLAGTADDLKEYTIGIDAFGKPSSYDPRQESVVRMHVARLRLKLAEERKAMPHFEALREGKPSKRDRRAIDRLRGRA